MDNDLYRPPQAELRDDSNAQIAYAGFWRRFGATIIDTILMMLITIPLTLLLVGEQYFTDPQSAMTGIGILINYLFPIVAVILFWVYKSATPGKMILGMKIVDARDGSKPSVGQFIGRYFAYILSALLFCLGYLWVAWDKKKQGWHDKLAKTIVVRKV